MKILNTDTNEVEDLSYHYKRGSDCIHDIIAADPSIIWGETEEEGDILTAPGATISFWRQWVEESMRADDLEEELGEKLGDKYLAQRIADDACYGEEFNELPKARIAALSEALASDKVELEERDFDAEFQARIEYEEKENWKDCVEEEDDCEDCED